jgi:hypothetical protein
MRKKLLPLRHFHDELANIQVWHEIRDIHGDDFLQACLIRPSVYQFRNNGFSLVEPSLQQEESIYFLGVLVR